MILNRWFKLDRSVEKSREGIFARLASIFEQPRAIDEDLWDELEELLLQADVGVHTTDQLLEILRNEVELGNAANSKDLYRVLREELVLSLREVAPADPASMLAPDRQLAVLLVVGVNGVGKTTSIAKLADYWKHQGYSGHAGCRRHVPRGGDRSAQGVGRPRRRAGRGPGPWF